jgi:beta-hydroxyacyl-ACP dehydratase FabZ
MLRTENIQSLLPHRFPMLLVDRILELEPGQRVVSLKNVTINEPFFVGHFPDQPVMPGVLIVEAMAQTAAVMMLALPDHKKRLAYLGGIDRIRFRRPVVPGDTLIIEATLLKLRGTIGRVLLKAHVDNELAAEGEMTFAMRDREQPAEEESDRD